MQLYLKTVYAPTVMGRQRCHHATANYIFSPLVEVLDRVKVEWTRAVSVATDGAPSMIGRKTGVRTDEILGESTSCKWRTKFLDISLYFAPGDIVFQVV